MACPVKVHDDQASPIPSPCPAARRPSSPPPAKPGTLANPFPFSVCHLPAEVGIEKGVRGGGSLCPTWSSIVLSVQTLSPVCRRSFAQRDMCWSSLLEPLFPLRTCQMVSSHPPPPHRPCTPPPPTPRHQPCTPLPMSASLSTGLIRHMHVWDSADAGSDYPSIALPHHPPPSSPPPPPLLPPPLRPQAPLKLSCWFRQQRQQQSTCSASPTPPQPPPPPHTLQLPL